MQVKEIEKYVPLTKIVIWEPRWHDRRVLIDVKKVREHNKIVFTKTKSLDKEYYLSGKTIKKYPKQSNGRIWCYAVPMDELRELKIVENKQMEIW